MAEAKITLQTIVEDKGLNELNDALADGTQKVKDLQRQLKQLEKDTKKGSTATKEQKDEMRELVKQINQQKQANASLNKQITENISKMQASTSSIKEMAMQLKDMAKVKFGVDVTPLLNFNKGLVGIVGTVATVSKAMVDGARDVAKFSNSFIPFASNMQHATEMYNKFNEVARNMNSSYDESQIYKMAQGLLAVGVNADESARLITLCADASAKLGKGVEFTEELVDAFKRLKTGGELTEKQYKALAEAGVDLTNVQEEIRKGGESGYKALAESLEQYKDGMNSTKQTASEMEADIKANLIEIIRQSSLLADEFFGFSEALKGFYQWVIETSNAVISSIKNMVSALRNANTSANAYASAMEEWEEIYGKDFKGTDEERALAQTNYARTTADVVAESEQRKQEAINETTETMRKQVQSIAKSSGGGGGKKTKDTTSKDNASGYRELLASQQKVMQNEQAINGLKLKEKQIVQEMSLIGLSDAERIKQSGDYKIANIEAEKQADQELMEQKFANYETLATYLTEHPFDGSNKILENLELQKQQEGELFAQRVQNYEQMIALAQRQKDEDLLQNSQKLTTVQQQWENYAKSVSSSMASAVASVINGEKSMGQALKEMAKQMITNALQMLAQWVMLVAILSAFQDPTPARHASIMMFGNDGSYVKGADGGYTKRKATGGYISGKGTGTSDSVPTMLSNGEYVLNSKVVDSLGVGYLDSLNAGMNPVEGATPMGGNSVAVSINTIDSSSFSDFLGRGGLDGIKQALFDDNRMFASEVGVW